MEWYQIILGVVVGLVLLMILVILHELGHAVMARRNGVVVEEFGLGFPPRARKLGKVKGTLVTLNWLLPLGGFCKLKGEYDTAKGKGTYGGTTFWVKTKILLGGVLTNLVTAMVIFTILALTGLPRIIDNQFNIASDTTVISSPVIVSSVVADSPASKIGVEKGDELIAIGGTDLKRATDLTKFTSDHRGQKVAVKFRHDGVEKTATAELNSEDNSGRGYFGVGAGQSEKTRATWSAPIVGVVTTFQFAGVTIAGLWDLVVNFFGGLGGLIIGANGASDHIAAAGDSVAGPVGILGVIFPNAMMAGPTQLFFLMGIISLTLAIMNTLPIPGLDGGRWFTTLIFRKILHKPLTREREETVNGAGMMILFGLIIVITVADVLKLL